MLNVSKKQLMIVRILSVQFSHSVVSDSSWPHGLQHTRLPCPSPTPRVCSNTCLSSWWCHPTILSSVILFSSCLQSFPASESFPMSQFFTSDGQSIGVSASVSVLPMNIQDWFPLGLTSWISLQSKELSFYVFALFSCAVLCCALCGILVLLPEIKLIAHGSGRAES